MDLVVLLPSVFYRTVPISANGGVAAIDIRDQSPHQWTS